MAKVLNTFLKSKMNKDLDARIIPEGEYRDAQNAQVSKSESENVGNLENVLGNVSIENFNTLTGVSGLICVGVFSDEINNTVYLFFTTNQQTQYDPTDSNFIISYNTLNNPNSASRILVEGAFLNFSTQNQIYGINILEDLLFFTDNRNQPRVIDVTLAGGSFYSTEDQISVAKYNPYQAIELFQKNTEAEQAGSVIPYETTMKDVSSIFLPNGGSAIITDPSGTLATINFSGLVGEINDSSSPYGTSVTVGLMNMINREVNIIPGVSITSLNSPTRVTLSAPITFSQDQKIVFNKNPFYEADFGGDPDYLEDRFVRFSYRFKYQDNTYSIFAPFTQTAFIPKQDGYFMYASGDNPAKDDQSDSYRSTVVSFMENKVNKIDLKIPLPFPNYSMRDALKLKEIDILYKESDAVAVRVIETIKTDEVTNQSSIALVNGNQTPGAAGADIAIDGVLGGIEIGSTIEGVGIPANTTVVSFSPTDPSNPSSGNIRLDQPVPNLDDNVLLFINDIRFFKYEYNSSKPTKTLPEAELVRVFDKTPVRSLAQEVSGNRVIYGNFENKHTPPEFINYNVAATDKLSFNLNEIFVVYNGGSAVYPAGTSITVTIGKVPNGGIGGFFPGMVLTCFDYGAVIPEGTQVTVTSSNTQGASVIELDQDVTLPAGTVTFAFLPGGSVENTSSKIEYPSSSLKTNRNYQVGFVLSDRYGRQSTVILSNNEDIIKINNISYSGSTLYSPYISEGLDTDAWPGNSLKVLVNEAIDGASTGLYNGDVNSLDYNPLGWYSYKIVVKQTQQEYYNIYLPGVMSSYPNDQVKELNQTSHVVLINDNINKVPRDLNEVGPEQRQFRSSVRLFGRVQNTIQSISDLNPGASNIQYYPGISSDTVSTISTINDLFEYDPSKPPQPNYFPQFYSLNSNPLVARVTTANLIGQVSTTNYLPGSGVVNAAVPLDTPAATFNMITVTGPIAGNDDLEGYLITGPGIPDETYIRTNTTTGTILEVTLEDKGGVTVLVSVEERALMSWVKTSQAGGQPPFELITPGIQYLAVYETEPFESLLDLYWETSSSGLISDLNSAVLNNQSNPAGASLGPISTQGFNEGLTKSGQVFTSNFGLLDSFGSSIALDTAAGDTLVLDSVVNGLGESCVGPFDSPRDFFRLEDTSAGGATPGIGPWNVRTTNGEYAASAYGTSPAQSYWENMFYMNDEDNSPQGFNRLRQFTFNFIATIHGTNSGGDVVAQVTNISINANLGNVPPVFYRVKPTPINPITSGVQYGTINSTAIPDPVEFEANPEVRDLVFLQASNGNANIDITYSGDFLGTRDLQYETGPQEVNIVSQTIGSIGGPPAQTLDGLPIFAIESTNSYSSDLKYNQFKLVNTQFNNTQLSSTLYFVKVRLRDGGASTEVNFRIDMRVVITKEMIFNRVGQSVPMRYLKQRYLPVDPGSGRPSTASGIISANDDQNQEFDSNGSPYGLNWTNDHRSQLYPFTCFYLEAGTPGLGVQGDGFYAYAGGFFDTNLDSSCNDVTGASNSLVSYSGAGNDIVIPRFSPNSQGHQCQTNILRSQGGLVNQLSTRSPYVKGYMTITNIPGQGGLGYNQVQVDPNSAQFPDFIPKRGMRCYARDWVRWDLDKDLGKPFSLQLGISRGTRYPQRINSYNSTTGVITFQNPVINNNGEGPAGPQSLNGGEDPILGWQVGDDLNFFGGKASEANPWFFGRSQRELAMLLAFSEWGPGFWYQGGAWHARTTAFEPDYPRNNFFSVNFGQPSCEPPNASIYNWNTDELASIASQCSEFLGVPSQPNFSTGDFTFSFI